jgi:hypothetical protein
MGTTRWQFFTPWHSTQVTFLTCEFSSVGAIACVGCPVQLQPALRAEWLDSDYGHPSGVRRQLTAGVATYVAKATRILVDLTRTNVESGSLNLRQPEPLQLVPYRALSNTCATVQLQAAL